MSEQSGEKPLEQDVLDELGDDGLQQLAEVLGTDAAGAQGVVGNTVAALSGGLRERSEEGPEGAREVRQAIDEAAQQPLQGVAAFGGLGGLASGGLLAGLLSRMSRPAANVIAKKTGLPAANVARGIELVIPVILAVLSKRATRKK
ncbi:MULTISPECIES: DUF937 domain-containing protein [unclassified Streptomyces]|uniref:DUF937 domain-containing protein n=1 Tax=unclassified Streptomyces TaxID=2593676 RepID=UPI000DB93091|nr:MULTISPECIES: DUF937 domain-containing protein [unclassified Streptomyces]MYT71997.1 DUF937 domain-containing protein [Streptomyces sp. SID8367]RAJ75379.1 uncharacterized protein DUF937 [Streptomyces sp. PsTaAH-137]